MADEETKPKAPATHAEGAGTKAHKPTKAELAKLPGGEDFDVAGASSEDFDKHFEILSRQAKLDGLKQPAAIAVPAPVAEAPAKAVPAAPNPTDIRAIHNETGEVRYFSDITWKAMETPAAKDTHAGWEQAVAKPSDLS